MARAENFTIALIGAGNMGGAMLEGWIGRGIEPGRVAVIDPAPPEAIRDRFAAWGVRHMQQADGPETFDVVMLAVKPQIMGAVLPQALPLLHQKSVAVSIAAGVTLGQLEAGLGAGTAVVRAMPNTPALIGRGITVACANDGASAGQRRMADALLTATGRCEWVDEEALIDAVTAVSGSGPAYVFHLAECMAAAGVKAGLDEDLAMVLARETVAGAGALLVASEETPAKLRANVTSPNGTTAAALAVLMEEGAMAEMFERAIAAARDRSVSLSEELAEGDDG